MSFWLKNQKSFPVLPYEFNLVNLWKEAFKINSRIWFSLLLADLMFIIISNSPNWMPILGQWFPFLKAFQINPIWMNTNPIAARFAALSKILLPYLFILFVTIPVYLSINLIALRIVYQRPIDPSIIFHYIKLRWWGIITMVLLFSGIVVVPGFFIFHTLYMIAHNPLYHYQFYVGISLCTLFILTLTIFFSMTIQLIFAARLNLFDALLMSYKAVRMHFWKITIMLVLLYAVQRLRLASFYLSDILLMPPSCIAWALLYKNIYGEKGLVE